jgi:UDP-glucose 4-epimerase
MNKISVVITGASGFIGSSLVTKLSSNNKLLVIPVSRSGDKKSHVIVSNYSNSPKGDILFHLAENSDRSVVNNSSEKYLNESKVIVEELIKKKYKKIIYFSSSSLYGDNNKIPNKEKTEFYDYDNYTHLKLCNEKKILEAGGMVIRLANVIGPGMSNSNVLSDIFKQVNVSNSVNLLNGFSVRDFIFIDDVINVLERLIYKSESGVFNLGSGVGASINELAKLIINTSDKQIVVNSPSNSSSISYNVVDIGKIKNFLDWEPKFSLKQSIKLLTKK